RRTLEGMSWDYVAYVPAGDELRPDALMAIVAALNETPDADVVYTDRDQRAQDGGLTMPFFKPDWSPALLLSLDYVSGLAVYRREALLRALPPCEFQRDAIAYELALRVTEQGGIVTHVDRPLYTVGQREKTDAVIQAEKSALQ